MATYQSDSGSEFDLSNSQQPEERAQSPEIPYQGSSRSEKQTLRLGKKRPPSHRNSTSSFYGSKRAFVKRSKTEKGGEVVLAYVLPIKLRHKMILQWMLIVKVMMKVILFIALAIIIANQNSYYYGCTLTISYTWLAYVSGKLC